MARTKKEETKVAEVKLTPPQAYARLSDLCISVKQNNDHKNAVSKIVTQQKEEVRTLMEIIGTDCFEENGVKITITRVENSHLNEEAVIKYLKKLKLKQFVHRKEYIDSAEILMAVQNNIINAADFNKYIIQDPATVRLNIK